jgi:D-beta-D-heptose 7-phosphate kinase/D-beta-D-heptose 1-phosphate adenosyltransferase
MSNRLPPFTPAVGVRVLVVGDVILDRYVHGETHRISPEAPVPVVRVTAIEERPGGAANVALNLRALGVDSELAGVTGADAAAETLAGMLRKAGVECHFVSRPGFPTVTKVRVMSQHQQLLRLDYEESAPAMPDPGLLEYCASRIAACGCIVLSDYAKGSLAGVGEFIKMARLHRIPVLVDPKGPDFGRYAGATVLTPNLREFEQVAGACRSDAEIAEKGERLRRELDLAGLLITRGERGMTLVQNEVPKVLHAAARAHEVYDVTGAGDTVIAALTAALVSGHALPAAMQYANAAAGLVVEKLGTASVTVAELNAVLAGARSARRGVLSEPELAVEAAGARARGERIVMTNGCFDILHAGHVRFLEQARALGDRLIVAVNDDASVRRLKGSGRPVNAHADRMAVISALGCVDWVTGFSADTPRELIVRIGPDVLAKGGDYRPEQVAGGAEVQAAGGQVVILPLIHGHSSSAVIDAVARSAGRPGGK